MWIYGVNRAGYFLYDVLGSWVGPHCVFFSFCGSQIVEGEFFIKVLTVGLLIKYRTGCVHSIRKKAITPSSSSGLAKVSIR